MTQYPERMTWRRSPDMPDDWHCACGRVYLITHTPQHGRWYWSMTAQVQGFDRRTAACQGVAETRDDAFKAVKSLWLLARSVETK